MACLAHSFKALVRIETTMDSLDARSGRSFRISDSTHKAPNERLSPFSSSQGPNFSVRTMTQGIAKCQESGNFATMCFMPHSTGNGNTAKGTVLHVTIVSQEFAPPRPKNQQNCSGPSLSYPKSQMGKTGTPLVGVSSHEKKAPAGGYLEDTNFRFPHVGARQPL